jgi:cytochrome c oxidase subunit 3
MADLEVRKPFFEASQQRQADLMGLYLFLATEIMLFGGLFMLLLMLRIAHPEDYIAASSRLDVTLGTLNTFLLLASSLFVALAVVVAGSRRPKTVSALLVAAAGLGAVFMAVKALEYVEEYREAIFPVAGSQAGYRSAAQHLFMNLYFAATALHAFHLTVGIVLLVALAVRIVVGRTRLPERAISVEAVGLYWHFVDVVWIFLFPVLYLAR